MLNVVTSRIDRSPFPVNVFRRTMAISPCSEGALVEVCVRRAQHAEAGSSAPLVQLEIVTLTSPAAVAAAASSQPAARSSAGDQNAAAATSSMQARLARIAAELGIRSAAFHRVPADYYEQDLSSRAQLVGAQSTAQLCKSMIMENTRCTLEGDAAAAAGKVKYVCIVLQYAGAKLNRDKLTALVQTMERAPGGRKQYNMRMVSAEDSVRLSGYEHNAGTPGDSACLDPPHRPSSHLGSSTITCTHTSSTNRAQTRRTDSKRTSRDQSTHLSPSCAALTLQ